VTWITSVGWSISDASVSQVVTVIVAGANPHTASAVAH
jgi:hypothetical protein